MTLKLILLLATYQFIKKKQTIIISLGEHLRYLSEAVEIISGRPWHIVF